MTMERRSDSAPEDERIRAEETRERDLGRETPRERVENTEHHDGPPSSRLDDRDYGETTPMSRREANLHGEDRDYREGTPMPGRDRDYPRTEDRNFRETPPVSRREADYRTTDRAYRSPGYGTESTGYKIEHSFGWLLAVGSIALLVVGALTGFNVINLHAVSVQGRTISGGSGPGTDTQHFLDGALLIIPGLTAAFLAMTLHMSDHHVQMGSHQRMFSVEHAFSYLGVLAAIAFATIGIVVGYDVLSKGYTQIDGITWTLIGLTSVLATGFHAVGHHVEVRETETEDIRSLVEERVGRALERAGAGLTGERGIERAR
jgi:hypothetical protein